ncbi:MAG: 16S rRNA pseudouridine(516) synthase [Clostridia bacterium]|nr:16S rRNA pseudouridine(516) synthase [Clostridia bacterium]
MRLDKLLSVTATATRKETARAVRAGEITVNGVTVKRADLSVDPERDTVSFRGRTVLYKQYRYILLNKPDGYVSATEDGRDPTVLELLPPELAAQGLFPCGRLDKHTLGLMLLTNNGTLAHRLLAPRRHVAKRYRFCAKFPLTDEECARFRAGLVLEDGYETKPADIVLDDARSGVITLVEGKYHQIKRMLEALHNQITYLERISFGPLTLPDDLARGAWRELTPEEEQALLAAAE